MSKRMTGATPEQINDAIRRHCAHLWSFAELPQPSDERIASWLDRSQTEQILGTVDYWARHLVPEGYVIARAADVLTSEMRMAWGELLDAANRIAYNQYHGKDGWNRVPVDQIQDLVEATDTVARLGGLTADELRAIANGGTDDQ